MGHAITTCQFPLQHGTLAFAHLCGGFTELHFRYFVGEIPIIFGIVIFVHPGITDVFAGTKSYSLVSVQA